MLADAGSVSALEAKIYAEGEYEKYRIVQDRLYKSAFDMFLEEIQSSDSVDEDEGANSF